VLFEITEYIGIIAFSLSGFYIAIHHKLDILGIFISAFLTALGGGIVRDTIAGNAPNSLVTLTPMLVVICMVIFLLLMKFQHSKEPDAKPLFIFIDSIGLVSFSISGALIAIKSGLALSGVIIFSFITAVGGGILRDTLINVVPYVLKGGFYGIISIIVGVAVYILETINILNFFSLVLLLIFGIIIRLVALKYSWKLPSF
jgi:uncharacterized membrane protein YeiH